MARGTRAAPLPLGRRLGGLALPNGQRFGAGAANPSAVAAAARKERKAAKRAEKAAARALLVQRFHPGGLPAFQRGGRTEQLSGRELQILKSRVAAPTPPCVAALAAELGRCDNTIRKGLKRAREPEMPPDEAERRRKRGGRPRTLTPENNAELRAAVKKDPVGGPPEAAKQLFAKRGVRASRWTIGRELVRRYKPGEKRVRKRGTERYAPLTDQELSMQLGHVAAMEAYIKRHGFRGLFWQDETPFVPGCAAHQGYGADRIFLFEKHSRYGSGEKVSLWGVMSKDGWQKVWVTAESGTDEVCRQFFCDTQHDAIIGNKTPLFKGLPRGAIMLVDRLGRSGRCKFPIASHYQPGIKALANAAGVGYMCLPPHGALLNPIELAWSDFKRRVSLMCPPGNPEDAHKQIVRGPRTLAEALPMFRAAVAEMNATPGLFRSFIHRRGYGKELLRRYDGTAQLDAARATLAGHQPFDLSEMAGRKRLVNIHAGENEPLTTDAQRAAYFRYFVANAEAGTAGDLPPPPPADEPGADGFEDCCRACQKMRAAKKAMPGKTDEERGLLLTCERSGCTAAYHPVCVGLASVPAGRWVCPGCVYAPGVAPRAVAPPSAPAPLFLFADDSDDE
jgi:hypothetical protein